MSPSKLLSQSIATVLEKMDFSCKLPDFSVENPIDITHGDFSTNIALQLFGKLTAEEKKLYKSPKDLALNIAGQLKLDAHLLELFDMSRIEVAGLGFINFWLSSLCLSSKIKTILNQAENYGKGDFNSGKNIIVEYTDPNPFKEFHIGHLMPNVIGESISRLLSYGGSDMHRVNYQGDVGLHVAKSVWGLNKYLDDNNVSMENLELKPFGEKAKILGQAYAAGAKAYEEVDSAKKEINDLNKIIYDMSDPKIDAIYKQGRKWSLDYFEEMYKKLGSTFDYYFFEREAGERGLNIAKEALSNAILEKSEGAVVFKGEKFNLHTRVFINSMGIPTYEAKDLGLAFLKNACYPNYDLSIILTGNEINEYFKVELCVLGLINKDLADKTKHIGHGMLRLPSGKMSSRTGNIKTAESLIEEVKLEVEKKASDIVPKEDRNFAFEAIAIGAIKYSILKQGIGKDVIFDFDKSLSFEGDSGPYLQYSYARAKSVLRKNLDEKSQPANFDNLVLSELETDILRILVRFPELIERSANLFAPNLLCSYLIELAQLFNHFYNKFSILNADDAKSKAFRLELVEVFSIVMKNGLWLLGIKALEKM